MSLVEFHQQSLSLPDSTRLVDVRPAGHVVIARVKYLAIVQCYKKLSKLHLSNSR